MKIYLNGYWDILPLFGQERDNTNIDSIEEGDFVSDVYMIPSVFCVLNNDNDKDMFNSFDYPDQWSNTKEAWVRKRFELNDFDENKRFFLNFGAITGVSRIWVNGNYVGSNIENSLPFSFDVTEYLQPGSSNEIIVRIADSKRTSEGLALTPMGGVMINDSAGIWQDVYLKVVDPVFIADYFYETSYRNKKINFQINLEDRLKTITSAKLSLLLKAKDGTLIQSSKDVMVESNKPTKVKFEIDAKEINFWNSEAPHLYELEIKLVGQDNGFCDVLKDEIGFREIWIEGCHVYINGKITHFYGDWGHRVHSYQQRPEYIRCWFSMLKDIGMNYVRLHAGPHDPVVYKIANEMGIYVCAETGLHGSGRGLATEDQEFWNNALIHAERFVRRDRNEVSNIFWSAGNEMRHNPPISLTLKELSKVGQVIKSLDQTRPVYYEGDSSLWDESEQEIISRHYGMEVTGEGWWDKTKPLHIGEMGKWHYGQPPENVMLGGNKAYESLWESHFAAGQEAALLIERARINDVNCLCTWNISCLDNPTVPEEDVVLNWEDINGPHPKSPKVKAFSSEFYWWEESDNKYQRGSSFDLIKEALIPETFFIWEKQSEYFVDSKINRRLTVVNDTVHDYDYELSIDIRSKTGELIKEYQENLHVIAGHRQTISIDFTVACADEIEFVAELKSGTRYIVEKSQNISICNKVTKENLGKKIKSIQVLGNSGLEKYFSEYDIAIENIKAIDNLDLNKLLIIGKDEVVEEKTFVESLSEYVRLGGRVLLLEQFVSIFKDLQLKPIHVISAHAQTQKFEGDSLAWWGEQALLGRGGQDFVAKYGYQRPAKGCWASWVDIGTGDFGRGGLGLSAFMEIKFGTGLLIASNLELTTNLGKLPSACAIMDKALDYLVCYESKPKKTVWVDNSMKQNGLFTNMVQNIQDSYSKADVLFLDGAEADQKIINDIKERVERGATAIVSGITPETRDIYQELINSEIELVHIGDEMQGVLNCRQALTEGLSNEDLFWYNRIVYTSQEKKNYAISKGYAFRSNDIQGLVRITKDRAFYKFMKGYKDELRRAKMLAKFGKEDRQASLLGYKKLGKGRIILNQIKLPFAEEIRSVRFWSIIMNNLGIAKQENFFGLNTNSSEQPAYPSIIHIKKDYSIDDYNALRSVKRVVEATLNSPELSIGDWADIKTNKGRVELPDCDKAFCLSYVITPQPRKVIQAVGGLPNPAHTTSLQLIGGGKTDVFVNNIKVFEGNLVENKPIILPELELEEGVNAIYILVEENKVDSLSLLWKNASGRDENELMFW